MSNERFVCFCHSGAEGDRVHYLYTGPVSPPNPYIRLKNARSAGYSRQMRKANVAGLLAAL